MTKQNFLTKPWKTFLPQSFSWLEKVQIKPVSTWTSSAAHLIPVVRSQKDPSAIEVQAVGVDGASVQQIIQAARNVSWSAQSGYLRISVNDSPVILVPVPKIKTNLVQVARQWGMDAARAVGESAFGHVVLCAATDWTILDVLDGYCSGLYDAGIFRGESAHSTSDQSSSKQLPQNIYLWSSVTPKQIESQRTLSQALALCLMLQDSPPNWLTPERFADIAEDVCKDLKVKCTVLDKKQISDLGMGSFISVSNGSDLEPRLIQIEIKGEQANQTVALLGKGLTFDAGGTSLKPAAGMGEMKYDMSGGAGVLAAAFYLAQHKPSTNVVCLIGAVENLLSGSATRPGDIVQSMSGKTIEVLNTDAEGRLVLCDLMHYAREKFKPELMVDIATLTGACLHALGHAGAAVMSNNQKAAHYMLKVAEDVGEPLWQLPLWPEFDKEIKSDVADIANIAKPNVNGGAILAGVFLKEFAGDTPWAHLDIAGTGWSCSATGYPTRGAAGYGVRLLIGTCVQFGKL